MFAVLCLCLPAARVSAGPLDARVAVGLPALPLGDALRALAKQANIQILFAADLVAGLRTGPLRETVSVRAALDELLRGSTLEAREQAPSVVIIRRRRDAPTKPAAARAAAAPVAAASTGRDEAMGEILITAERREERLQEVPISVSAFPRTAMEVQGSRSIDDIARLTPGVDFIRGTNYNSESSAVSIRGIASVAGTATTGVYIDDTPIQSRQLSFGTFDAYPHLFDLDRVEVLRGPQGTLFGSGSEGGTIRFITPDPQFGHSSAYARAEIGATANGAPVSEFGMAGGSPLIADTLSFRASASYRYEGGYIDRIDWHSAQSVDPHSNASTTKTARLALEWRINDALSITPSFYHQYRHVDDTSAWWAPAPGTADPTGGQFDRPFRNGNAIANPSTDTFELSTLKIDWSLAWARLLSNTSYFKRNQAAVSDYAEYDRAVFLGNPYPPPGIRAPTYWADNQSNWTEELRLESAHGDARAQWTAGLFFQRAHEDTIENVYDPALVAQLGFPLYKGGYLYYQEPFSALDSQVAAFGQIDLRLANPLTLTLGLRYGDTGYTGRSFYAGPVVGPPVSSTGTLWERPLTPKVGLSYRVDPDTLFYASVAKGYRVGGANPAVGQYCYGGPGSALGSIGLSQVPAKYDSDSVWSYEIGSKASFADGRALLDASAYIIEWKDIQQNVALNACGFQFTANLGTAESRGFDLQAEFKFNRTLTAGATFGLTDAYYTRTVKLAPTALSIVQEGDHIAGSPWKADLFSQASFPLLVYDAYARIDFQYAAQQTDVVPAQNPLDGRFGLWSPAVPVQSYTSLRTGVKWRGFDASVFVQNLFDTHPRLTVNQDVASPGGGTPLLYVITWRPRTVGLTLTYHH
ncbi:MAG TPA: TonB-dependent receptor [Steroidobacteraceae bacterium]|nr:TonB-dependent receptor [Steroidobacteraceae bacterium]